MPKALEMVGFAADPERNRATKELAERLGVSVSALLRAGQEAALAQADATPVRPSSPWRWCLADFREFASGLTLPDGGEFRLEGHMLAVLREVWAEGRVEVLALLPKGNFKTTLFASVAVFHLVTVRNANCFIGAADRGQAEEMYRFAAHFAESDGRIGGLTLVRRSTREVRSEVDQGFIRVLASDDSRQGGKRQGFNPTLVCIDELHAHENPGLYLDLRTGLFKRSGLLVTVTTAGHDEESVLGELRKSFMEGDVRTGLKVTKTGTARKAKDGRLTVARSGSGRSVMFEWACRKDDDLSDPRVVKLANPASGVTLDSLADALDAPGITPQAFARYRANVWVQGFDSWLPADAWDKLAIGAFEPADYLWPTERRRLCVGCPPRLGVQDGDEVFGFIDMGRYRDTAALVCVAPRGKEPPAVWLAFVERSGGKDHPVEYAPVKDAWRALDGRYKLLAAGFDPKYFDQSAEELDMEGLPMVNFPQTHERMCPASANLRQAILAGGFRHDGDPVLAAHVRAATMRDVGADAWRLDKPRKGAAIDAAVALAGANQLAFFRKPAPVPFVEVV